MASHRRIHTIYRQHTITSTLLGMILSTVTTIAPIFFIIGVLVLMYQVLGFHTVSYVERELFSSTILYIFIFALLFTAPFNSVLSRYITDIIFEEEYDGVLPCFYGGLVLNLGLCSIAGILFYLRAWLIGGIPAVYSFTSFLGFLALSMTFYAMLYLTITKDYIKLSLFFCIGAICCFLLSLFFVRICSLPIAYSMLLSLTLCFLLIATLEFACISGYFRGNNHRYFAFLPYFRKYWQLMATNTLYTLALYIHNFVFWTMPNHLVVNSTYICYPPYDMATCIAMFTNISASVILITQIELNFQSRYKAYSEAVIGGKLRDIDKAKERMFRTLSGQLMHVARTQFAISVIIYLFCVVFLPQYGFAGMVMDIYPCLAAGYFIVFFLYSCIIYLYYFNDLTGALLTSAAFLAATFIASIAARKLPDVWYGVGVFIGAFAGWSMAYCRIRWIQEHLDEHIFCRGKLIPEIYGEMPSPTVYHHTIND